MADLTDGCTFWPNKANSRSIFDSRLQYLRRPGAFRTCAIALVFAVAASVLVVSRPALAVEAGEMLADPVLEARARALSGEFRCLVCQNESIDESNAQLAHDLRVLIREQVNAGQSDAQIRDFLVARYGQFVLLRPRFDAQTLLLWLGPFLILGAGAGVLFVGSRRARPEPAADSPLSEAEKDRLASLNGTPPSAA